MTTNNNTTRPFGGIGTDSQGNMTQGNASGPQHAVPSGAVQDKPPLRAANRQGFICGAMYVEFAEGQDYGSGVFPDGSRGEAAYTRTEASSFLKSGSWVECRSRAPQAPAAGDVRKFAELAVVTYDDPHLSAVSVDRAMADLRAALAASQPSAERRKCKRCEATTNSDNPQEVCPACEDAATQPSAEPAPASAQGAMHFRTCCDHPDCTTCAGFGGYYRLTAAPAAPAVAAEAVRAAALEEAAKLFDGSGDEHIADAIRALAAQPAAAALTCQKCGADRLAQPCGNPQDCGMVGTAAAAPLNSVSEQDAKYAARYRLLRCYVVSGYWPREINQNPGILAFGSPGYTQNGLDDMLDEQLALKLPTDMSRLRPDFVEWRKASTQAAIDAAMTATPSKQEQPQEQSHAARDVLAERQRQKQVEGWTPEHDDGHGNSDMAEAAACYITGRMEWSAADQRQRWPWSMQWWKPKSRRQNLVRAAALLVAEIERLDRAATPSSQKGAADE